MADPAPDRPEDDAPMAHPKAMLVALIALSLIPISVIVWWILTANL